MNTGKFPSVAQGLDMRANVPGHNVVLKVAHIGYAVPDIESARNEFELLGWRVCSDVTDDVDRKVKIQFMRMGDSVIELVAPLSDDSPIRKTIHKGSGVPYHICYEAESLDEAEAVLKARHFVVFKKPKPAPAIDDRRVEWFYAKNLGIIELVETNREV